MALIPVNETYYTVIDSESPMNITFRNDNSSYATITFLVSGTELVQFINDMLGTARLFANSYVRRTIPASHPYFGWLYASKITSVKGYSPDGALNSNSVVINTTYKYVDVKIPAYNVGYKYWKITVQYEARNYAVLTDANIDKFASDQQYFQPRYQNNGVIDISQPLNYRDHKEYLRYTTVIENPKTEFLTYGVSNYVGLNSAGVIPPYQPLNQQTVGSSQILLQKTEVKLQWFYVPYDMCINNKTWINHYNKINYFDFMLLDRIFDRQIKDFYLYPEGTLLLQKIDVQKYDPYYAFETVFLNTDSVSDYFAEYNKNVYADVTFNFLYFNQSNLNTITAGGNWNPFPFKNTRSLHNRLPDPNWNLWYYVETGPSPATSAPIYWAYPTQNLFNYEAV